MIESAKLGELESSTPLVRGDQVTLKGEECGAGGRTALYDNSYTYARQGSKLTFEVVANKCADKVAETILTRRPWVKQS